MAKRIPNQMLGKLHAYKSAAMWHISILKVEEGKEMSKWTEFMKCEGDFDVHCS